MLNMKTRFALVVAVVYFFFIQVKKYLQRMTHRPPKREKYMSNKVISVRVGPVEHKQLLGNSQHHLYFIGTVIKQAFPFSCSEIVIKLNKGADSPHK